MNGVLAAEKDVVLKEILEMAITGLRQRDGNPHMLSPSLVSSKPSRPPCSGSILVSLLGLHCPAVARILSGFRMV